MSKKKSFMLRIDPDKMDALEKWAADEFRSINGQLEWIIDQALKKSGRIKQKTGGNAEPPIQEDITNE
ncbi:hypothetical protein DSECCO2_139790 [anaerobic digester metagenome]|jgi:hypothetical protein|nr:Arc family DNA-binding protein [Tenuifilaceae bacterium]